MESLSSAAALEQNETPRLRRMPIEPGPWVIVVSILLVCGLPLIASDGLKAVLQTGLNGLAFGGVVALGAVGLTLIYGILKLVNFAHGDFLTFGAYIAFAVNAKLGMSIVAAALAAVAATALLGLLLERALWSPLRGRGAGMLQLLLASIGVAFVLRYGIEFVAGPSVETLDVDRTAVVDIAGLRIGRTALIACLLGFLGIGATAALLRFTLLGKRMRALSDSIELAETTGIDTRRVITITWLFAGGVAGLAGVLFGATANVQPALGFQLLLPIFAAVVLGGIGQPVGAMAAGLLLGVITEWATLVVPSNWKLATGFLILIVVLIVRPEGLFGRERSG